MTLSQFKMIKYYKPKDKRGTWESRQTPSDFDFKTFDENFTEEKFDLFCEGIKLANLYYFCKDLYEAFLNDDTETIKELKRFASNDAWLYFDTNGDSVVRRVERFYKTNKDAKSFHFPKLEKVLEEIKEN